MSAQIPFEGLRNTRDLGGTKVCGGAKIKCGKLIRSGQLYGATPADIEKLSPMLSLVIDFRTTREKDEKPDPEMKGVEYLHDPVFDSLAAGVARDVRSDVEAFKMVSSGPERARDYMTRTYRGFVENDFSVSCYSSFVKKLAEGRDGAVLWHCTAGKDRAGFATVVALRILGAELDDIFEDYLSTNKYLTEECAAIVRMVSLQFGEPDEKMMQAFEYLFNAKEEYLNALIKRTEELYGGFDGFIENALGADGAVKENMRSLYLE